jgi:RNA polymerase sigma factor (TIGR02999 family)
MQVKDTSVERRENASSLRLTEWLVLASRGDAVAANRAMEALYAELHKLAASCLRRERPGHTLQPTALVHEAYIRLLGVDSVNDRRHFVALAAQAMRRVLVDHARGKQRRKRGAGAVRVTLDGLPGVSPIDVDVIALDEALTALSAIDERAARVVELRYFCGYTDHEVCDILQTNLTAVRRDWAFARSWLKHRLGVGER